MQKNEAYNLCRINFISESLAVFETVKKQGPDTLIINLSVYYLTLFNTVTTYLWRAELFLIKGKAISVTSREGP
jgi:hypothetical protein